MRNSIERENVIASENNAFKYESLECRYFPSPLHIHPELELVYITSGDGLCFCGDKITRFKEGDLFFFSSNLVHYFRSGERFYANTCTERCGSIYIQFKEEILPSSYMTMPGCNNIRKLIENGYFGIKWEAKDAPSVLIEIIKIMSKQSGFSRLSNLYYILNELGKKKKGIKISSQKSANNAISTDLTHKKVLEYISLNFHSDITLADIAQYANMNDAALCRYFKTKSGKSIFEYLAEFRINYAKEKLVNDQILVSDVAYSAGFNSVPHFNVQFKKYTGLTPTQYKKRHSTY